MDGMWMTVLVGFGCFWAGWALGSWRTGANYPRLVLPLVRGGPEEKPVLQPTAKKKGEAKKADPEQQRWEEEWQRMQDLLDNIDAYGTNVPQKKIKQRGNV